MHYSFLRYDMVTDWARTGEVFHSYGWYHWLWIGITIFLCAFSVRRWANKHDARTDDRFVFCCGAVLILTEVYKQMFHYLLNDGAFDYSVIPYQFCSVPMYIMVLAPLLKTTKLKDALYGFLGYFSLLAGLSVMLYPETCLNTNYITMLIHTMLWHCLMVVVGIYLVVAKRLGTKSYDREVPAANVVFMFFVFIAVFLNESVGKSIPGFNLFYLSFKAGSILPFFSMLFKGGSNNTRDWIVLIATYILAFNIGTALEYLAIKGIRRSNQKQFTIYKETARKGENP